ncbi:synaptotagmin-like protein 1 [Protopterus annectens]|uniref:synaptotagmin-like protein 1 n=1 Tax=Protopterus annectens TaxID=7888 RepID=UPI001CFB9134|nr:synaptotagmin-like protein 1 [Protopterus annectens]XP_043940303.1 synaptotagmin-like protein 1 [Protopterus annectens]
MSQNTRAESLLDLSFLTEEEQKSIAQVLSRDADLRAVEQGRINKLRKSVSDLSQLKFLTGEWFNEARSKRHRDKQYGTEIIRASIRKRKKQYTGDTVGSDSDILEDAENIALGKHSPLSSSASEKNERNLDKPVFQSSSKDSTIQNVKVSTEQPRIMDQVKPKSEVPHTDHQVQQSSQNIKIPSINNVEQPSPHKPRIPRINNEMEQSAGKMQTPGIEINTPYSAQKSHASDNDHMMSLSPGKSPLSDSGNKMAHSPGKSGLSEAEHKRAHSPGTASRQNGGHRGEESINQVKNPEINVLPQESNEKPITEKPKEAKNPVLIVSKSMESDPDLSDDDLGSKHNSNHVINPQQRDTSRSASLASLQSSSTVGGSMMSLYGDGDFGSVDVKGAIQFSLRYDEKKRELHILIVQCQDLAEAKKQRTDAYVKSYLLPDKSSKSKRKTSVKKKTLSPLFNETLKYKIDKSELQSRTLNISVWHHDNLGRNVFLGEVEQPLDFWDWSNTQPFWCNLQPRIALPPSSVSRGRISVSLMYKAAGSEGSNLPPTGELHFWVKEGLSLIPIRTNGADSFVKCFILPDDRKSSRQKTRIVKKNLNPVFNHTMVFDGFRVEDLKEVCAEFTVWDHETFHSQVLGGIRLSMGRGKSYGQAVGWMDSNPEEIQAWKNMINSPNTWVETVLPLRSDLTPRM